MPEIYIGTWRVEGLSSQGRGEGWILKIAYLLENYIGTDDLNDIISEVLHALMYVVLSKEENHVLYGELDGTTECITL
jgi:hypothetical protein